MLLKQVAPYLNAYNQLATRLCTYRLNVHCSALNLLHVLTKTALLLFKNGFCVPEDIPDDAKDDDDDINGNQGELEGGTGMAANEQGDKDVSNEIEDEEQVLGLKGDE